jgi:hypothetical protein
MSIINQLVSNADRKDEQANIDLAQELINNNNLEAISEIIEHLQHKDRKIQHDCIKIIYEIGYLKPELISKYALTFLETLKSKNNRMVWGAMTALSTIAEYSSDLIMPKFQEIVTAMKVGSVITVDKSVLTLAKLASVCDENNEQIFPILLKHLETCRTKEVPQHAESTFIAVTNKNKADFLLVLQKREVQFSPSQLKRIKKIYKLLEK